MRSAIGRSPDGGLVNQPAGIIIEELNLKVVVFHDVRGAREVGYFFDYRFERREKWAGGLERWFECGEQRWYCDHRHSTVGGPEPRVGGHENSSDCES
jgi:hypothetical protein